MIEKRFADHCTDKYEGQLADLKCTPWIGKNYEEHGILVLGASHHAHWKLDGGKLPDNLEEKKEIIQKTKEGMEYKDIVNDIVLWHGIDSPENNCYSKFTGVLLDKKHCTDTERKSIWSSVAFTNAIQDTMTDSTSTVFTPEQSEESWQAFKKIVGVLKPKVCISWGKEVIWSWANSQMAFRNKYKEEETFNRGKPRIASDLDIDGHTLSIISIRHPSNILYNIEGWYNCLMRHCPNEILGLAKYRE